MAKITDDEILNLIADRLEYLEKAVGSEGGQELARARRAAARERRLLKEETLASENVAAGAADQLMKVHEGLAEAQSVFKALAESANAEVMAKERSARNSTQLLQSKMADLEQQLADTAGAVQELTGLVTKATQNAAVAKGEVDNATEYAKRLMQEGELRQELRTIAAGDRQTADEAFVMEIAMKAIRQALDSGVIPKQLQPKPERPAGD